MQGNEIEQHQYAEGDSEQVNKRNLMEWLQSVRSHSVSITIDAAVVCAYTISL